MGLDIYVGNQKNHTGTPIKTINLPDDLLNFLKSKNIFIDEYGTSTLQMEQMATVEKLVAEYSKTKKLASKHLEDLNALVDLGKNSRERDASRRLGYGSCFAA